MSDPITMAVALKSAFASIGPALSAALSVGSTAVGYLSAQGAASAQEEANRQADDRARQYMIEDYDQMNKLSQQEVAGASQKQFENAKNAARARATTQVAASAGGVSGLSVDSLLTDLYGQEASIRDSINQNLESTGDQLAVERRGIHRNTVAQMASRPQPQRPSLLGAAFEAGTGVYGAYKDTLKVRSKTSNAKP